MLIFKRKKNLKSISYISQEARKIRVNETLGRYNTRIIKIRAETIKEKTEKQQSQKLESWFFEMFNKMDKPLVRFTKSKREKI